MYSIYVNKRPRRVAFFVDPRRNNLNDLDAIWLYNQEQWGGRFNPIVMTDGCTLTEEWWSFISELDPDYIHSLIPLSHELVEKINESISPVHIKFPEKNTDPDSRSLIHTESQGIPIIPSPSKVTRIAGHFLFENPKLAVLRSSRHTANEIIHRFVLRSFGLYPEVVYMDNALNKVDALHLPAHCREELIDALQALSRPGRFAYPIQFSALGSPKWDVEYDHQHAVFGIIVGDTFEEQVFAWNKVFYASTMQQPRLNHIWLPTVLATDSEILRSLGQWLRWMAEGIHVFSFSISADVLKGIADRLVEATTLSRDVTTYGGFPFPSFVKRERGYLFLTPPKEADHYRTHTSNEMLELKSPADSDELPERGEWMADVYIEADESRHYRPGTHLIDRSRWWCLPKNRLAADVLNSTARVTSSGIPSVALSALKPHLKIKLPDDVTLLRKAIEVDLWAKMSGQVEPSAFTIDAASSSNIGRYLTGFLEVFGGLDTAYQVLSSRYWRRIFDDLSSRDAAKDQRAFERAKNKLSKKIAAFGSYDRISKNIDALTSYVLQIAREVSSEGRALQFSDFVRGAEMEIRDFNQSEGKDWEFDVEAVYIAVSEMLELGILQSGVSQACPRCGSANYYQVDDARQRLRCDGCRLEFPMRADPKWLYRLNSLAQRGIAVHGLVPVVLVLGQLFRESRISFFFAPSLDLFCQTNDTPPKYDLLGDLDIVCIKDGKLVIGEVKQSQKLFDLSQMLKLADIATQVQANVLLFSSLDELPNQSTTAYIEKAREKLENSKITVEWYQLSPDVFKPEPVR
jgi:hypothetical protein